MQALLERSGGGIQLWHLAQPDVKIALWIDFTSGMASLFEEKNKKSWASVGLPSGHFFFSHLVEFSKYNLDSYSTNKENSELKFMQQDVGFLSCCCVWGLWLCEIVLNHLQDPREDADKILSQSSDSPAVLKFIDIFFHLYSYHEELICSFSFSCHIVAAKFHRVARHPSTYLPHITT